MKKVLTLLLAITFVCSCSLQQHDVSSSNFGSSVKIIKNAGLYDSVLNYSPSRSVDSSEADINVSIDDVIYFIENPDEIMTIMENNETDNGSELINAMYSGATIGEVAEIMAETSDEMSKEYLENVEYEINTINRNLTGDSLSIDEIKNIQLTFSSDYDDVQRGAFAKNMDWNTIYWYYGMCGTTIAGLAAYKWVSWWQPWVAVAGLATAAAGGASMAVQLGLWSTCSDLTNFVNSFIGKDGETIMKIINGSQGKKLLAISGSTLSVVGFCVAFTPEVSSFVISKSIAGWNRIMGVLTYYLPKGLTLVIQGIPLVAI